MFIYLDLRVPPKFCFLYYPGFSTSSCNFLCDLGYPHLDRRSAVTFSLRGTCITCNCMSFSEVRSHILHAITASTLSLV